MSSVLTIAGATIDRVAARVVLNRLTLSLDRPDELEFTELGANLPGAFAPEAAVTLTIDGTTSFSGWVFSRAPDSFGVGPGRVGYRCLGLSYGASMVPITASDGTGTMAFNLPVTDPNYVPTQSGKSVGDIIKQVLDQHAAALAAIGVTSYNAAEIAALTVVSPDPVSISGNSLWQQLAQLVQQWYGSRYALYCHPSGVVRCHDTTNLTSETITLDADPAILTAMSEDTSECYTQVVLRGRADVEPAYLSIHDGTLAPGWTADDQSKWNYGEVLYPTGAYDVGALSNVTSTQVTVRSDDAKEAWATNFWDGIQGQIALIDPAATNINGFEYRQVTACSALVAGGTATITVDRPLTGNAYTRYQLRGEPGGLSAVWRKYTIPNTYVAQHLAERFNFAVPWMPAQGVLTMTNFPTAVVCFTSDGLATQFPARFEVVPYDGVNDGYILFYQPVVALNNSQSALVAGGSNVSAPVDVQVLVPYSRGPLSVTSPSGGGHSGTAHTLFGVERTLYRDYPSWIDGGASSSMQVLADSVLATCSNAIQEGSITYLGKYSTALIGGSWPICLSIARATGTTGYESMKAPVRTLTLEWPQSGGAEWVTHLSFSTRRQWYSGDRLYVHPMYAMAEGGLLGSSEPTEWSAKGVGKTNDQVLAEQSKNQRGAGANIFDQAKANDARNHGDDDQAGAGATE